MWTRQAIIILSMGFAAFMPNKNFFMKFFPIVLLMLMGMVSYAHQPDLSSVVVSKTDDGKYVMQVTSSLTAFEWEVDYNFGQNAYKTPDEFRDLVITHFRKNISLVVNNQEMEFVNPMVLLGHETKWVAEITGIPSQINSIDLKSTMFKDMHHNQSAVMMIAKGFPTEQYILNNENSQQIKLESHNGMWKVSSQTGSIPNSKNAYYLLLLLVIPIFYFINGKIKKRSLKFA